MTKSATAACAKRQTAENCRKGAWAGSKPEPRRHRQ